MILSNNPKIEIWNDDCLNVLKNMPDKSVDLVLTDPPYGKMWTRGKNGIGVDKISNENDKTTWDIKPTKEVFDEIMRVSKNQIIFGGQYFTDILLPSNCWIVWDKRGNFPRGEQIPFADCELAWTSFNKTIKKYTLVVQGFVNESKDERVHPTQKPSEMIQNILKDFSKETDTILDPFMGSGTTGVACANLNRNFIGIEISKRYCEISEERIMRVLNQQKLF